jgi:hypothetical protein
MLSASDFTGEAYHHTLGDVALLRELAGQCPPHSVAVNIGACFGTSSLALLEGNPTLTVFSVDVRPCPEEGETCAAAGQPGRRLRILGPSQEAALAWPRELPVALVLVDGGHDYEAAYLDILRWSLLVQRGGWLLIHDCGTPSLPEVPRAVRDVFGIRLPDRQVDTLWGYRL